MKGKFSFKIIVAIIFMNISIDFYNQTGWIAKEVNNIMPDYLLSAEMKASKLVLS